MASVHPMMAGVEVWCRVAVLGPDGVELDSWQLSGAGPPDLGTVDTIARMQLLAKRRGRTLALRDVCPALADLLDFAGLRREVGG